jgi:formylmethanofuran dehydrogenase subunit D
LKAKDCGPRVGQDEISYVPHGVFSASLRNPGTKASSNSGFKDDEC